MRKKRTSLLLVLSVFLLVLLTGCGDKKAPISGYIEETELSEIIQHFDNQATYTKYSYNGNLNYFGYADEVVPNSVSKKNVEFVDALDFYQVSSSSYYLRLPLHLTVQNWNTDEVDASTNLSLSTRYQLESKIYRPQGLDKIYYYARKDGGFILRAFAVNKNLVIKRPSDISCHAKWNVEVEYDADGYLVREYFATVNSSEANKNECCYGEATYVFS